jgi:CheY-like chemotaxis protein
MMDVFFIGDATDTQFGETIAWLRSQVAWRAFADIETAIQAADREALCPAVVFLGQSRRGQFTADFARLIQTLPLTRVVVIVGCWCEGEMRSGAPLAGVHRVAWHQAPHVVPRELDALAAGRASLWSWPVGEYPGSSWTVANSRSAGRLVVALSESAVMAEAIAHALCGSGFATVAVRPAQPISVFGAEAVVWDVAACGERAEGAWTALRCWLPEAPIVALVNFPRPEDIRRLQSIGVTAILGKPFQVADLVAVIERLVGQRDEVVGRQGVAAA